MKNSFNIQASIIAIAGFACSGSAMAQQPAAPPQTAQRDVQAADANTGTSLEDIVVTAQRRSENMQLVPVAVTAVSGEALANAGIQGVVQLGTVVPGLNITTNAGAYILPRIRGIGSSAAGPGFENPVATYIDGVYIGTAVGPVMALSNVQQIAVLKGPQGTLFGRNATGGVIQVTTRDPGQEFTADISATYGNNDTIGTNIYVSGGLTDGLAADLSVYYNNQRDGFGVNTFNNVPINRSEDIVVRSKLIANVGEDTTAKLVLDYVQQSGVMGAVRPMIGSVLAGGQIFQSAPRNVNSNVTPDADIRQGGAGLTIEHRFEGATLTSTTAYRRSHLDISIDTDRLPVQRVEINTNQEDKQFSQELQLSSDKSGPLRWTLGGYYFWANARYDPLQIITNPRTNRSVINVSLGTESIAAYGQATYELTPAFSLTAGLRYTSERRSFDGTQVAQTATSSVPVAADKTAIKVGRLTWRMAADYKVTDDVLLYASYNRGFKSGGYNAQFFPASSFGPETIDAYELGIKSQFADRAIRVNSSFFYYDYKDLQVPSVGSGILVIRNAGAARIYGLDMDVAGQVTSDFVLTGGLSVIHHRYTSFPGAQITTPNPAGGNFITFGDVKGNKLLQTPDWTLNLGADYTAHLNSETDLRFNTTFFHSDGWFSDPDNKHRQKPYNLVNASMTLLLNDSKYSLSLWGRNLGNTLYANQLVSSVQGYSIIVAPGRSYGLTARAKF